MQLYTGCTRIDKQPQMCIKTSLLTLIKHNTLTNSIVQVNTVHPSSLTEMQCSLHNMALLITGVSII